MKINKNILKNIKINHVFKIKSNDYTKNMYNSYISIALDTLIKNYCDYSLISYNFLKSGDIL